MISAVLLGALPLMVEKSWFRERLYFARNTRLRIIGAVLGTT
jgi:hypothetical protein